MAVRKWMLFESVENSLWQRVWKEGGEGEEKSVEQMTYT